MKNNVLQLILNENQFLAIIEVTVKNKTRFMDYVDGHLPTIAQYGGKIIFEGFEKTTFEGSPLDYGFLVIQQWDSKEAFEKWWNSPEYKPWKEMRHEGADVTVQLVKQRNELH